MRFVIGFDQNIELLLGENKEPVASARRGNNDEHTILPLRGTVRPIGSTGGIPNCYSWRFCRINSGKIGNNRT
jgi:hypothetical protein